MFNRHHYKLIVVMALFFILANPVYNMNTINTGGKEKSLGIPQHVNQRYNFTYSNGNVLWSRPLNGSITTFNFLNPRSFSLKGPSIIGNNLTGSGAMEDLFVYATNHNATLYTVDSINGSVIWSHNFINFAQYYMVGTDGRIPLIMVMESNAIFPYYNGPLFGTGYVNLTMVNGITGFAMWYRNVTLVKNEALFFTTNETIFSLTNPLGITFETFYYNSISISTNVDIYSVNIFCINSLNGSTLWDHPFTTIGLNSSVDGEVYPSIYPLYLSLSVNPTLRYGGVFYTYVYMNSAGAIYTDSILLNGSDGSLLWNVTSPSEGFILTDGTNLDVSEAIGNFTGGIYYDLAYTTAGIVKNGTGYAIVTAITAVNLTDGAVILDRIYKSNVYPGVSQFAQSTPSMESSFNIDNATGGIGPLVRFNNNSIPGLVIMLYDFGGGENISLIDVWNNRTVWTTPVSSPGFSFAGLSQRGPGNLKIPVVLVIPEFGGKVYLLNGNTGAIIWSTPETAMTFPAIWYASIFMSTYSILPYLSQSNLPYGFAINLTIMNTINGTVIKNYTLSINEIGGTISYFVSPIYINNQLYLEAGAFINRSNNWTDYLYIISPLTLTIVDNLTASMHGINPSLMVPLSWTSYIAMFHISYKSGNTTFPLETEKRFYEMDLTQPSNMKINLTETTTKSRVPFHDTFKVNVTGGIPSYNYTWYENMTILPYYSNVTTISFNTEGVYNISVKVRDLNGKIAFANVTVNAISNNITLITELYSISGVVTDVNNTPVYGVNVSINKTEYAYTNDTGSFNLIVENGSYSLSFSKTGYQNETYTVSVEGKNVTLRIEMKSSASSTNKTGNVTKTTTSGLAELDIGIIVSLIVAVSLVLIYLFYPKRKIKNKNV